MGTRNDRFNQKLQHDQAVLSSNQYRSVLRYWFMLCSLLLLLISTSYAHAASLNNGGSVSGSISAAGEEDTWTFNATAGDVLNIQLVDLQQSDLFPLMTLYAPDGSYVTYANNYTVANIYNRTATVTGTYTLVVKDGTSRHDQIGDYEIHFVKSTGASEHGELINGGSVTESISLGDIDSWTFDATAGEMLNIQIADLDVEDFFPLMTLYAPDGSYITYANNYTVANIYNRAAPQTGTYTLVVQDGTGPRDKVTNYEIHFAKSTGANEHGELINGGSVTESISLGDLDSWTFDATAGEMLNIQIADLDVEDFFPLMTLYAPDGSYITYANNYTVANINNRAAPQTGTYTLVVQDGTGPRDKVTNYEIHFAKSTGANEHGELINGGSVTESISLGDLDSWTFDATAGEMLNIQIADFDVEDFFPLMTLYAPDGSYITYANNYTVANIYNRAAPQTGTYTLVVQDGTGPRDKVTNYEIHFAKSTGANEHGELINGGSVTESISLGDLDSWTFDATAGEMLNIQIADLDVEDFFPLMTLYAPDGSYITYANNYTVANIYNRAAPQTGTYTLVVQDGTGPRDKVTNYEIHFAKSTGANEHGKIAGQGTYSEAITLGDLDSFTFDGNAGDEINLVLRDVDTTDMYPLMTLYKPDGTYFTYTSNYTEAGLYDLSLPLGGTYVLIIQDGTGARSQIGDYILEYNLPIAPPDPQKPVASASTIPSVYKDEIIELDGTGSFDPDDAPDPLSFNWTLVSVPDDSLVKQADIVDATSAMASIQPDVYGEYQIELSVSDGLLNDSIRVLVQVVNRVPVADAGIDQNAITNAIVQLDGSNSSDADGDLLTYQWSAIAVPIGSGITSVQNSTTVNPSFLPDVAGEYVFSLVVSDDEDASSSDTVIVQVNEANVSPQADLQVSGQFLTSTLVTLDGRASFDSDNGPEALTYAWLILSVPTNSVVTSADLDSQNTNLASFIADVAGSYRVRLTVFDGELSHSVDATVLISDEVVNQAPEADAGSDQQQELGTTAELSAASSFDPDSGPLPLSFSWIFVSIPAGSNLTSADLEMDAKGNVQFIPDVTGLFTLEVTVSDGDLTDSDSVVVNVTENQLPVADAGIDQNIDLGTNIVLDGSASFDPDNGPQSLSYAWQIVTRPTNSTVNIVNSDSVIAEFQPDVAGQYIIELTVNDDQASDTDEMVIEVVSIVAPKMCDIDSNDFIDRLDIRKVMQRRNTSAMAGFDPADWDQNGLINVLDARGCALECELARCAIKPD